MNRPKTAIAAGALVLTLLSAGMGRAETPADRHQHAADVARHLKTFDTLDYDVFSNQKWERLKESHSANVAVHWPDGHVTRGIDRHISDLKWMFTFAPDTRIKVHPVKLGEHDWTAVVGVMEGTFTRPMTMPDGRVIQPTGKSFRLPMSTISHWKNGVMDEEYLFWDNQTYFGQMGVAG